MSRLAKLEAQQSETENPTSWQDFRWNQ
jgi:hypothetical protein